MLELMFEFGNEVIMIVIKNRTVTFRNTAYGAIESDISGLSLDYVGVVREFPDLETREDWKEEAMNRFKFKISQMPTEEEISKYIIKELKAVGYIPKLKWREGFRPEKI